MKKIMVLTVVAATIAAAAVGSFAAPDSKGGDRGPGGHHGGPGGMGVLFRDPELAKSVGVTDEQLTKLREMSYQHQREMIKLEADMQIAELDLEQLKRSGSADLAALDKAVDAVQQAEGQIEKNRIRHMTAVKQLLGEETLEKIGKAARAARDEWREERRDDRRGGREGRREGKSGPGIKGPRGGMPPPAGDMPPDDGPEGLPED